MKTMKMIQKNKKAKSLFILIDKINLVKYKRYFTRFILIRVNIQKIIKITIMQWNIFIKTIKIKSLVKL